MPEELENEGTPNELTDEELDRLSLARVVERGLTVPTQAAPVVRGETIGNTGIEKPANYDLMDYQDQISYIAEQTRKITLAEARTEAKKEIDAGNASVLKELQELKGALKGTLAPVMKGQVTEKIAQSCPDEAKPFIAKAIEEAEARYKKSLTKVDDNEAWLLAGRAEALYHESKRAAAPQVVYSDTAGVPESGADKRALKWLSDMKTYAPGLEFTYAEALAAIKEDSIGI